MGLRESASPASRSASNAMTILTLYVCCSLAGAALALWRPPQMPRYWLLLAIAAVPQLGSLLGIWIPGMFLVSVTAIFIWCLCNRALAGIPVVAAGVIIGTRNCWQIVAPARLQEEEGSPRMAMTRSRLIMRLTAL